MTHKDIPIFVSLKLEAAFGNMDNELSRHAEDNKKKMEDLISQLTAASQEQQTVVKKYQNVNKGLIKEQEKKEEVIKELGKELHKTKFASENSKAERGSSHSFQKKLEENERQLIGANTTINILKQEKEKIEKEREYPLNLSISLSGGKETN